MTQAELESPMGALVAAAPTGANRALFVEPAAGGAMRAAADGLALPLARAALPSASRACAAAGIGHDWHWNEGSHRATAGKDALHQRLADAVEPACQLAISELVRREDDVLGTPSNLYCLGP